MSAWAVVTGASRGIGADLALEVARRGYNILLVARDSAALEGQRERLKAASAVETRIRAWYTSCIEETPPFSR